MRSLSVGHGILSVMVAPESDESVPSRCRDVLSGKVFEAIRCFLDALGCQSSSLSGKAGLLGAAGGLLLLPRCQVAGPACHWPHAHPARLAACFPHTLPQLPSFPRLRPTFHRLLLFLLKSPRPFISAFETLVLWLMQTCRVHREAMRRVYGEAERP